MKPKGLFFSVVLMTCPPPVSPYLRYSCEELLSSAFRCTQAVPARPEAEPCCRNRLGVAGSALLTFHVEHRNQQRLSANSRFKPVIEPNWS